MSWDVKIFVALAPVCLAGMVFSLTQGDLWTAGVFAFLQVMMVVLYRTEKRLRRRSIRVLGSISFSLSLLLE